MHTFRHREAVGIPAPLLRVHTGPPITRMLVPGSFVRMMGQLRPGPVRKFRRTSTCRVSPMRMRLAADGHAFGSDVGIGSTGTGNDVPKGDAIGVEMSGTTGVVVGMAVDDA